MFYREVDTEAVLGHLVLIGLLPKLAKFTGSGGPDPTANPNSWDGVYSEAMFYPAEQTHQEPEDTNNQSDRITRQLAQPSNIHGLVGTR